MKNEYKDQYLPADKDLLDEVDGIGLASTGTGATTQLNKLLKIQIQAVLRNRKTAYDLDKSTRKYSLVLIAFASVQVIIAIYQFIFDAGSSSHPVIGSLCIFAIFILGFFIFRDVMKLIEE